jgi:hypothetical protein
MGSYATGKGAANTPAANDNQTHKKRGPTMNASTLAAAFSNALTTTPKPAPLSTTPQPVAVTIAAPVIPMRRPEDRWMMNGAVGTRAISRSSGGRYSLGTGICGNDAW